MICIIRVMGAALSGMESYLLRGTEVKNIQVALTGYLRVMLKGKGTEHTQHEHLRRWDNDKVHRHWGITLFAVELYVRRVRWAQEVVRKPEAHPQYLAVMFGTARFEEDMQIPRTMDESGKILETAHPWASQFTADIEALRPFEGAYEFFEQWNGTIKQLFDEKEISNLFVSIDAREVRAASLANTWAPPATSDESAPADDLADEVDEWTCDLGEAEDTPCGQKFGSRKALLAHQRQSGAPGHGWELLAYKATLTNQCPICLTTFASRQVAFQHLARSLVSKRCLVDRTRMNYRRENPKEDRLWCPLCEGDEAGTYWNDISTDADIARSALQRHIAAKRLPASEVDLLFARDGCDGGNANSRRPRRRF